METKICTKCDTDKELCEFGKDKYQKDGFKRYCKICTRLQLNKYTKNNTDKVNKWNKQNHLKNKEKILKRKKEYYKNNSEKIKAKRKDYVEKNYDKVRKRENFLYYKNHEFKTNKARINSKIKYDTDILFRLKQNVRNRIKDFLKSKNIRKHNKTFDIVGCSPKELKNYLEKQFKAGMTWENHGFYGWHIDHKLPLSSGKTEEEILKLCHYTNLQPLWGDDNLKKGNKIIF